MTVNHWAAQSDHDLVAACNRGRTEAFEQLYRRHHQWVLTIARRFVHDRELALDVMQETFLYLLKQFPGFTLRADAKLTTYLYPVTRHLAITQLRKRREQTQHHDADATGEAQAGFDPPLTPADPLAALEARDALDAAMARLSDAHREVLLLRFIDQMTLEQIAAATHQPLGTVKSRLHHALANLRQDDALKNYFQSH